MHKKRWKGKKKIKQRLLCFQKQLISGFCCASMCASVRNVHWNAQCRRAMQVLLMTAAREEEDDEETTTGKLNALSRVARNEDTLWLSVVWVQHDEHDVVVDISEGTDGNCASMCASVRNVHWNAQCRRAMQVLLMTATREEEDDEETTTGKLKALSRVARNEDTLWLSVVWVQHDEHDVVVDISEGTEQERKCQGKKHALVINATNATAIEDYFLNGCSSLTALDLSPLSNVTAIEGRFLFGCSSLSALDLSPLSKVTTISDKFLSGCSSLTALDLSPLSNVTTIEGRFLSECSSLTSLDLSPLSSVTAIEGYFLFGCSSLAALDLSPLSNVKAIEEAFLGGCSSLTALDLSPLSNVTAVGDELLAQCSSLAVVDVSGLPGYSPLWRMGEGVSR